MKPSIIHCDNIGIKFELQGNSRSSVADAFKKLFSPKKTFWALKNITFDIKQEEIFYIIGRNGAGKSTLLKVLAETLYPDEGSLFCTDVNKSFVSMSLGFRNELSGYENIDISLKLMGINKDLIPELKKDIVEFTQLRGFIHEPVENYSAGMRARLAFAIATSNTPDILIMDEVINTGDEVFRQRCKQRLDNMLGNAKCVVICTHSLPSVLALATRVVWIERGKIMSIGDPQKVVEEYRKFITMVQNDPFYDQNNIN